MTTSQEEEGGLIGMARRVEETWKSSRLATKFEELEFRTSRGGIVALVVNSDMGYANRQIGSFIREVPPGKKSGKHIHNFEAIIHIIKGHGYTMLGDNRVDWKVGDTMSVPPMLPHQHFNLDPNEPARFFAVITLPLMVNTGQLKFEQLEWAE